MTTTLDINTMTPEQIRQNKDRLYNPDSGQPIRTAADIRRDLPQTQAAVLSAFMAGKPTEVEVTHDEG